MKPLPVVLAAATATAAIIATTAGGQAPGAPAARTFSAATVPGDSAYVDTGKRGDSPGDILSFVQRLKEGGAPAGTATATAISAGRGGKQLELTATITLKDGTVTIAGLNGNGQKFTLPIVGGTGAYVGVRGTAAITDRGNAPGILVLDFTS